MDVYELWLIENEWKDGWVDFVYFLFGITASFFLMEEVVVAVVSKRYLITRCDL